MIGIILGLILTVFIFIQFGPAVGICWLIIGMFLAHITR